MLKQVLLRDICKRIALQHNWLKFEMQRVVWLTHSNVTYCVSVCVLARVRVCSSESIIYALCMILVM